MTEAISRVRSLFTKGRLHGPVALLLCSCAVSTANSDFGSPHAAILASLPLDTLCVKACPIVGLDSVVGYRPSLTPRYAPEAPAVLQLEVGADIRAALQPRRVIIHSPWSNYEPVEDTVRVALYLVAGEKVPRGTERYGVAIMPPFGPTYVYDATVERSGRGWKLASIKLFFAP